MKKILEKLLVLLVSGSLASCALINAASESSHTDDSDSTSESGSESSSETESEKDSEQESEKPSESSESESKKVNTFTLRDDKNYIVGDTYSTDNEVYASVAYTDGTGGKVDHEEFATFQIKSIKNSSGDTVSSDDPFTVAGDYTVTIKAKIINKILTQTMNITVASRVNNDDYQAIDIEVLENPLFNVGDHFIDRLNFDVTITFTDTHIENYHINESSASYFTFELFENSMSVDYQTAIINAGKRYDFYIAYQDVDMVYHFEMSSNYYKLEAKDLSILSRDINNDYAPATGEVSFLVIPITLNGNYTSTWTEQKVDNLDEYYFGSGDLSLKNYYERASFNQMEVSGMVTSPYVETEYSVSDILNDYSYDALFNMIQNAVDYVESTLTDVDFSNYDLNDDGCLDNVHLITNFDTSKYRSQTSSDPWGLTLWPHMFQTGYSGTVSKPAANVYSISAIDHVEDAITAIHEQGHIFGLQDYYDYGYTGVDYVGYADMQSMNIFDWNSYSKLTMGWVSPYVVRGECDITINAASSNGDCIIIPANIDTFNNSAFDEYFLIELFSPYGNNSYFWNTWCNSSLANLKSQKSMDLGGYGIRLYHVDSRLCNIKNYSIVETDNPTSGYTYLMADNNNYSYDRDSRFNVARDFKQLTLIQAGKVDTFGQEEANGNVQSTWNNRHYLNKNDLFKQGDVFTFSEYAHFLSKQHLTPSTMDNGETFPYKIEFVSVSSDSATIRFSII